MRTRVVNRTPEWRYQAEVVARLHSLEAAGWPFTCAGDMNRGKRTAREQNEAKVTGMTAGEADLRIYLEGGVLLSAELKTPDGRRSKDQKKRHARLESLGFEVVTVAAATPAEMADQVEELIRQRIGRRLTATDGQATTDVSA